VEKIIEIKCKGANLIDWRYLSPFQDDLVYSTEDEIDALSYRIIKKGFDNPISVWKSPDNKLYTLDGHRRRIVLERLEEMGYKIPPIPVDYVEAADEKDAKERILGFRSQFGHVTQEGFDNFIKLADIEIDVDSLRIDNIEIDTGIHIEEDTEKEETSDEDEYEVTDIKKFTKEGDLIKLGRHSLICGDAKDANVFEKLLGNKKVELLVTSPPYNMALKTFEYGYNSKGNKKDIMYDVNYVDKMTHKQYKEFLFVVLANIRLFVYDDTPVLWNVSYSAKSRDNYGKIIFASQNPFSVKETIIWDKGAGFAVAASGILTRSAELIFLMSIGKKYKTNQTSKGDTSVYWNIWRINVPAGTQIKGRLKACFPIKVPMKAIELFSKNEGDNILDCFMGSGTTLLAAEKMDRNSFGIELSPDNCDLIIYRYCKYKIENGEIPEIIINNKQVKIDYTFDKAEVDE